MLISWASQQQAFKPAVQLDFTTGALDPRITFARSSTGTYVNSTGVLTSAPANTPRFDYDPATLAPKGLLIESQRTNLLLRSEEFDNASWVKANATITANIAVSPDGTMDADKLIATVANSQHRVDFATTSAAATHAFSVYAKPAGYNFLLIRLGVNGGYVNLSDGTVAGVTSGYTLTATPAGNGWYRVVLVGAAALNEVARINVTETVATDFAGDGTSGIFVWGAQLEAGSFATSYIPTVASQVTRAADQASIVAPNFAPWYNQSEGTFVVEAVTQKPTSLVATVIAIDASDGGINNRHYIGVVSASAEVRTVNGGSVQSLLTQAYTANVIEKYAYAVKANDFAFARNGNIVGTDTSGSMPTIDRMFIGNAAGSAAYFNGHIRSIRYFPTRLSNAQLQALSA